MRGLSDSPSGRCPVLSTKTPSSVIPSTTISSNGLPFQPPTQQMRPTENNGAKSDPRSRQMASYSHLPGIRIDLEYLVGIAACRAFAAYAVDAPPSRNCGVVLPGLGETGHYLCPARCGLDETYCVQPVWFCEKRLWNTLNLLCSLPNSVDPKLAATEI